MTIETFNPPIQPSTGARKKPTIKILEAEFGDGYTQSCPDGINYIRQSFELVWEVLTHIQSDYIESFFEARGGVEHFHWTAPGDSSPKKWTCKD
jgi:phage-related protein